MIDHGGIRLFYALCFSKMLGFHRPYLPSSQSSLCQSQEFSQLPVELINHGDRYEHSVQVSKTLPVAYLNFALYPTLSSGKNKRLTKSKKGGKKKAQNPFDKKEWYNIKAPSIFANRDIGKTLITKTAGTKIASDGLKGRVFEVSLADLNKDEDQMYRKVKLCAEDVQGYNVMTNFHGMDLTRDKLCSLIKKWVTLIEANVDIKTTDGECCCPS
jgi:hypothetical protein